MTKTLDLINAIEAGQSMKIHSLFEELVNARLVEAIEQRRAEIADLVFNGPVVEEAQLDEEFVQEMSQYDLGDVIEFMLSEEFGSIDELSKTTLGNYVKKAAVNSITEMTEDQARKALAVIQKQFPKNSRQKYSVSGTIPMDWFERNEAGIREFTRVLGLRVMFRAPRFDEMKLYTKRSDATGVVLVNRGYA